MYVKIVWPKLNHFNILLLYRFINKIDLLLQQILTEVNHPDHLLITYPDLGHSLSISSKWISQSGPMEEYVLRDIFEWLSSRSG